MNLILVQTISDCFRDKKVNKAYLFGLLETYLGTKTIFQLTFLKIKGRLEICKLYRYNIQMDLNKQSD